MELPIRATSLEIPETLQSQLKIIGSQMGILVVSKEAFRARGQDKVKACDPLERIKRLVEVLEYKVPQCMAMRMAAQLSTGEVVHMPKIVRVEDKSRKGVTLWGEPLAITNPDVVFTHAFLITRDNRLISKRPFDHSPKVNEIVQMRIRLTI